MLRLRVTAVVIIGLLILALFLSSCAYAPKSGVVVEKAFKPQEITIMLLNRVVGKTVVPVAIPRTIPAEWSILVDENGKRTWVEISETNYNCVNVNDFVILDGDLCGVPGER